MKQDEPSGIAGWADDDPDNRYKEELSDGENNVAPGKGRGKGRGRGRGKGKGKGKGRGRGRGRGRGTPPAEPEPAKVARGKEEKESAGNGNGNAAVLQQVARPLKASIEAAPADPPQTVAEQVPAAAKSKAKAKAKAQVKAVPVDQPQTDAQEGAEKVPAQEKSKAKAKAKAQAKRSQYEPSAPVETRKRQKMAGGGNSDKVGQDEHEEPGENVEVQTVSLCQTHAVSSLCLCGFHACVQVPQKEKSQKVEAGDTFKTFSVDLLDPCDARYRTWSWRWRWPGTWTMKNFCSSC